MAEVIEMPKLSDTMEEGAVANWLKKEGDFVEEGEPLVEIETDKATMEYMSPEEGTLLKIIVGNGGKCDLNDPIAVIGEKGEDFDLSALTKPKTAAAAPAESPATSTTASVPSAASAPTTQPISVAAGSGSRLRASPLAKKIAAEKGIDLSNLQGSGPGGRVIMRDLENTPAGGVASPSVPMPAAAASAADQDIPVSMMRKTIAKRLLAGKNDAPHFYLTVSANMQRCNEWRARLNEGWTKESGKPKISVNDLIVLGCARALMTHPEVNASWQGDFIRQYGSAHVAVAVALPAGLVTPVIRHTDRLGVRDISAQTKALVAKARDGGLAPEEYQGGTFTISNLGMYGIEEFTAIINPPQACILAVGATIDTPWAVVGELAVQPRMKMTLSCDHRVVDGALGAQFLQTLVKYLEDPLMMLS